MQLSETIQFTSAASVDYTAYTVLSPNAGAGETNKPDRMIGLRVSTPQSTGTAVLRLALCDSDPFSRAIGTPIDFALTIGTTREGTDGASGNYHVTVVSSRSGGSATDREDLNGFQRDKKLRWRLGLVSSTFTVDSDNPLKVDVSYDTEA